MIYSYAIACLVTGILAVTIIDTLGAIASRKMRFNYEALSILSIAVFLFVGYFLAGYYNLLTIVIVCGLIGFYDGTIGFRLSQKFKANTALSKEQLTSLRNPATALFMIIIACISGWLGHLLA